MRRLAAMTRPRAILAVPEIFGGASHKSHKKSRHMRAGTSFASGAGARQQAHQKTICVRPAIQSIVAPRQVFGPL